MRIIKLNAIDSTNSYLRRLLTKEDVKDFTIATANQQTHGRGQMGTVWKSEKERNLIASVYKDLSCIELEEKFDVSIAVSLSIYKALKNFNINKLKIKWPNDILADEKKIGGILIENVIKKGRISASIIGIGINLNQTNFDNLPQASSLRLLTGKIYDRDEILFNITQNLNRHFNKLEALQANSLRTSYQKLLFRRDKPSTFQDYAGNRFSGFIKGVSKTGKLILLLEDDILKEFDFKEVTLLY